MTTLNKASAEVIIAWCAMTDQDPTSRKPRDMGHPNDNRPTTNDASPSTPSPTSPASAWSPRPRNGPRLERQPCLPLPPPSLCSKARSIASATATLPEASKANRDFAECLVAYDPSGSRRNPHPPLRPQTAGGLLIAVSAEGAIALTAALQNAGVPAVEIGDVLPPAKTL